MSNEIQIYGADGFTRKTLKTKFSQGVSRSKLFGAF